MNLAEFHRSVHKMKSYHAVAIGISVVMVAFSLVTLISFFYCIYVMCQANRDQSTNEVGNDTMKSGKSTGYSRQTTTMVSVEDNRKTKLPPSLVWSTWPYSEKWKYDTGKLIRNCMANFYLLDIRIMCSKRFILK